MGGLHENGGLAEGIATNADEPYARRMSEGITNRYRELFDTGRNTDRTVFFSDAVMAIAMTLLVLEIRIPDVPGDRLWQAIVGEWDTISAYLLSFVIIGMNWIFHHRKFVAIGRYDAGLQWINLLFLLFIAVLPLPTRMLSEYGANRVAVICYAGVLSATALAQTWLWVHAWRRGLMKPEIDHAAYRYVLDNQLPQPIVFGLSILICLFIDPQVAMWFWIALFPVQWLVGRLATRRAEVESGREGSADAGTNTGPGTGPA